jgi:hypothetical protein
MHTLAVGATLSDTGSAAAIAIFAIFAGVIALMVIAALILPIMTDPHRLYERRLRTQYAAKSMGLELDEATKKIRRECHCNSRRLFRGTGTPNPRHYTVRSPNPLTANHRR